MPKGRFAEDLTGRRYGSLVVINRIPSKVYPSGRTVAMFECKCDCGNVRAVPSTSLRNGSVVSCGCKNRSTKRGHEKEDLTGRSFGRWTVIGPAESIVEGACNRRVLAWNCRCECGMERVVRGATLKSGRSRSCGCLKSDTMASHRDLTGKMFGRWTVLGKGVPYVAPDGRVYPMWHCQCSCGRESDVAASVLLSGRSVSCGCYRVERLREVCYDDFTGCCFGELTAVQRLEDRHTLHGHRVQEWLCHCSCGVDIICSRSNLASGSCTSCGHDKTVSSLEVYTRQYLDLHGYEYIAQKRFDDLVGPGGLPLSYDFMVVLDGGARIVLIECQGRQHYEPVDWFGGEDAFNKQKIRDRLKADYAMVHGFELLEVPYCYNTYAAVSTYLDEIL